MQIGLQDTCHPEPSLAVAPAGGYRVAPTKVKPEGRHAYQVREEQAVSSPQANSRVSERHTKLLIEDPCWSSGADGYGQGRLSCSHGVHRGMPQRAPAHGVHSFCLTDAFDLLCYLHDVRSRIAPRVIRRGKLARRLTAPRIRPPASAKNMCNIARSQDRGAVAGSV
jgi:hypothetical protein